MIKRKRRIVQKSFGVIEDRSKGQQVSERPVWDPNQDIDLVQGYGRW